MYIVQWISLRDSTPRIRREEFRDFARALKFFIDKDVNSYVERVELILDKGYGADARETSSFQSIEEVVMFFKEGEGD